MTQRREPSSSELGKLIEIANRQAARAGGEIPEPAALSPAAERTALSQERQMEAMSLELAGLSIAQIAKRMDLNFEQARTLLDNARLELPRTVETMRSIENARLDRAQAAIWSDVLSGDLKAVSVFLRISERRARMNGLDQPIKVELAVSVKQEMDQALAALENVVMGEVVERGLDAGGA